MRDRLVLLFSCVFVLCLAAMDQAVAQEFQTTEIVPGIFIVKDVDAGDQMLVIASDSGLVLFDSFWSERVGQKFRTGIARNLKRDDFFCLINTVDRIDMFGGNSAFEDIPIVGHKAILDQYGGNNEAANAEVARLAEMWREKENIARERLPNHEPGSEQAVGEQRWINMCKLRADDLEFGFSLVLPTETFEDRKTIELGDLTLNLIWFGRAGKDGMTVFQIPEAKLAIIPGFIMHPQHLAPCPQPQFERLDVPRWISVMEELFEGENAVEQVLCGMNYSDLWSRDRAHTHLHYIRELWNAVSAAEADGKDLAEIDERLSLENDFAFVKEMQVYKENSDDWIRPQHQSHVRLFFLQHKTLASEILMRMGLDSLSAALEEVRKLRSENDDLYVEERTFNSFGYTLMNMGKFAEAVEVLRFNVESFPQSANVYDSYAEALMKNGDSEGAILNYKKSLELNPENENARSMLETLEGE